MRQGKWEFDKTRKLWQAAQTEEHVVQEITARLWYGARIEVYRVRERIPSCCNPRCRHYKSEHNFGGVGPCKKCPCQRYRGVKTSQPGIPDLIGYIQVACPLPGANPMPPAALPLFIEVKRPGGARRTAQIQFIEKAKAAGCAAFFAESWKDCVEELSRYGVKLAV